MKEDPMKRLRQMCGHGLHKPPSKVDAKYVYKRSDVPNDGNFDGFIAPEHGNLKMSRKEAITRLMRAAKTGHLEGIKHILHVRPDAIGGALGLFHGRVPLHEVCLRAQQSDKPITLCSGRPPRLCRLRWRNT